jgi:hypothetical protein
MPITVHLDVMLARRKCRLNDLAARPPLEDLRGSDHSVRQMECCLLRRAEARVQVQQGGRVNRIFGSETEEEALRRSRVEFWEIQHTVVNGTKDRKSAGNSTRK